MFGLGPNYGRGNGRNGDLFQKNLCQHVVPHRTVLVGAPDSTAATVDPRLHQRLPNTHRLSLAQSVLGSLLLSPGSWCVQGFVCALQESVSSVLCKFWQLCGRVNDNLLQEGLCHTQVCCTQSSCPCISLLLTCTSTGDKHSQAGLPQSLWGLLVCTRVWLSPPSISGRYGV